MNKIEEEDWTAKLIKIKNKIWWYSRGRWEDDTAVYVKIWTGTKEQWIDVYPGAVEIHEA